MGSDVELGPELNWTCGFSPDGPLECLDVATWHGFQLTDDGQNIECMMASCDVHRAKMRAHFEHPMQSACGLAGSRFVWPENFCYVEWGDEPALVGEVSEPVAERS
jgi:hypothetical protein